MVVLVSENIFIRSNRYLQKVDPFDIIYIQSEGNYCVINTDSKKHVAKVTLGAIVNVLDASKFVRIHRGYVVQVALIDEVNTVDNEVKIGGTTLPMGRSYKDNLLDLITIV